MKKPLKIKVCGMKYAQNILEVKKLLPDFMGFIFYEKSKRRVDEETFSVETKNIKRIGVFVNETVEIVLNKIKEHQIDGVQLHGDELPQFCELLKPKSLVIKAFQIDEKFDFNQLKLYEKCVDYFLFDTKTNATERGGTGKKFNWKVLENYKLSVPFFLSGGITNEDIEAIKNFHHPQLYGVDINSGFEESPAVKNIEKISTFMQDLKK